MDIRLFQPSILDRFLSTMKVALYARVSTIDQQTIPMQLEAMRDYSEKRNWEVVKEVQEIASGANNDRPKREEILKLAKRRKIDAIVVWKLDRWGRSLPDLVTTITEFTALGVGFISITESMDLSTPVGKALAGMLAVFCEFERDILRERIKAGIQQARKNGKPHGRPQSAMKKADEVKILFEKKLNKSQIAKKLGISRTSVRRILIQETKALN